MRRIPATGLTAWGIALLLLLPAFLLYVGHFAASKDRDLSPTGFIQYDQACYMANAREHFDTGTFTLFYKNPFSSSYSTPSIYFQPATLLLGIVAGTTHWDPGIIWVTFGFFAAWSCTRVVILLYRKLVGLDSWAHWLGLLVFCWGGGLLSLAGLLIRLLSQKDVTPFVLDPFDGWWFLNFGRNLVFPLEAFYHAVFLLCIYFVVSERYRLALAMAFLLSASHAFTGIQLILVLLVWAFLEVAFFKRMHVPRLFYWGCLGLFALHVAYYVGFLGHFPEHRSLVSQWAQRWTLDAKSFIPADILVGGLAVWSVRTFDLARVFFRRPANRLLLVWWLVSFALAKHEAFIAPVQPLHFTRGYTWMPLFFMGASALVELFVFLGSRLRPAYRYLAIGLITGVFLMDNALWIGSYILRPSWVGDESRGLRMRSDQKELLAWMNSTSARRYVVLSQDKLLGYYVPVYTRFRSWRSHRLNTPYTEQRTKELSDFFESGRLLDVWREMPALIVLKNDSMKLNEKQLSREAEPTKRFSNRSYTVFSIND